MSDSFTPAAEPAAPTTDVAPSPESPAPSQEANPSSAGDSGSNGVHPAWDRVLENIPEAWAAPIKQEISNYERETQKAIEKARAESTPAEWRNLVVAAQQHGLTPEQFVEAYNGQQDMARRVQEDPDAFVSELSAYIDQQVAAGVLTRRQGAAAKQQVANAAGEDPVYESDEARQIAELKAWKDSEEQRRADEAEAARKQQQQEQQQRTAQEYGQNFMRDFDAVMQEEGFLAPDASGNLAPVVPVSLQHQIALQADAIMEKSPNISFRQAIEKATSDFRQAAAKMGAQLPVKGGQQRQQIPVLGGGSGNVPPANPVTPLPAGTSRSDEAVRVMREMLGQ